MRMKDELDSLTATASTAQYGIEATMPKAVGAQVIQYMHMFKSERRARYSLTRLKTSC